VVLKTCCAVGVGKTPILHPLKEIVRDAYGMELLCRLPHLAAAEPWKFYDLGHGYCSYDFFEQCPHRMACAKCSFYLPKESTAAALLEGKSNLLRMRQEIPLTEAEIAALDDGVSALESLLSRLQNSKR
jgi:hypothetical protein